MLTWSTPPFTPRKWGGLPYVTFAESQYFHDFWANSRWFFDQNRSLNFAAYSIMVMPISIIVIKSNLGSLWFIVGIPYTSFTLVVPRERGELLHHIWWSKEPFHVTGVNYSTFYGGETSIYPILMMTSSHSVRRPPFWEVNDDGIIIFCSQKGGGLTICDILFY